MGAEDRILYRSTGETGLANVLLSTRLGRNLHFELSLVQPTHCYSVYFVSIIDDAGSARPVPHTGKLENSPFGPQL